jgi:hypothetical protein
VWAAGRFCAPPASQLLPRITLGAISDELLRVSPKPCTRRYSRTIRASRREGERAHTPEERACTKMRAHACMHSICHSRLLPRPALKDRPYAPRTPPLHAQAFLTPSLASLGKILPSTRVKCDTPSPRMRRPSAGIPHLQAVHCAKLARKNIDAATAAALHGALKPPGAVLQTAFWMTTSDKKARCCCCLSLALSRSLARSLALSLHVPRSAQDGSFRQSHQGHGGHDRRYGTNSKKFSIQ